MKENTFPVSQSNLITGWSIRGPSMMQSSGARCRFMQTKKVSHSYLMSPSIMFSLNPLSSPPPQPPETTKLSHLSDLCCPGEADRNLSGRRVALPGFTAWERIPSRAHRDPFKASHMKSLPLRRYLTLHLHIHIFRTRRSLPVCCR